VKNQQRWNFGVVYPPNSSEGATVMETQCLAMASSEGVLTGSFDTPLELDVKVRFLHLTERNGGPAAAWQEGTERQVLLESLRVADLAANPVRREFDFPAICDEERSGHAIQGAVEVSAEHGGGIYRLLIRLENLTAGESGTRNGSLLRSLVSAHKILTVRGGEFLSLIDPPEVYRDTAESCVNTGTFPVLAGEEGQRDVMLSSPIILYDYPQIAPESQGDLCDGTEIDEILSLRILTLTDEEKREMRESDERGRRILERTEAMAQEQWMKLHGVLRELRSKTEWTQ
jgi:hydrogenase maturation protease